MNEETAFKLGWVYNLSDYRQMFALSESDLRSALFNYPAGVTSFNAEMFQLGYTVCSGDPHYNYSLEAIQKWTRQSVAASLEYVKKHKEILKDSGEDQIAWISALWEENAKLFLEDYELGKQAKRYQFMTLPRFPFHDFTFDLALCANYLLAKESAHNGTQRETVQELCRIAKEVRVFPLLDETGSIAQSLGAVMKICQDLNYGMEVREVEYQQLKGGNAMLRIWATECVVK